MLEKGDPGNEKTESSGRKTRPRIVAVCRKIRQLRVTTSNIRDARPSEYATEEMISWPSDAWCAELERKMGQASENCARTWPP
jgi:hypothetical protein